MELYTQATKLAAALLFFTLALAGFTIPTTQAASPSAVVTTHPHKPSELLVKYKPGISALQGISVAQRIGAIKTKNLTRSPKFSTKSVAQWQHITLPPGLNLLAIKARLESDPSVELVELNYEYFINQIPNDPLFSQPMHQKPGMRGLAALIPSWP
jgi:hypothetical protein